MSCREVPDIYDNQDLFQVRLDQEDEGWGFPHLQFCKLQLSGGARVTGVIEILDWLRKYTPEIQQGRLKIDHFELNLNKVKAELDQTWGPTLV